MKLFDFLVYLEQEDPNEDLALQDVKKMYIECENELQKNVVDDEYQTYLKLKEKFESQPKTYLFGEDRSEAVSEIVYDSTNQELTVRYRSNVNVAYTYDVNDKDAVEAQLERLEYGYNSVGRTLIYWKSSGVIGHCDT